MRRTAEGGGAEPRARVICPGGAGRDRATSRTHPNIYIYIYIYYIIYIVLIILYKHCCHSITATGCVRGRPTGPVPPAARTRWIHQYATHGARSFHGVADEPQGWSNDTTADGAPMMSHDGSYGGFETTMFGYLGAGAGGRAAPGTAGRLVAVAASTNLDGGDSRGGRGACAKAVSEVLATLAPALADRYWDA